LRYSYDLNRKEVTFASAKDINASFKDLCAVCDAVRYMKIPLALDLLDKVVNSNVAIEYRRHNKYMGSRHELGGRKGRYPKKCADIVRKVIINASANVKNKGGNPDSMYIVHAAANKTLEMARAPPKGIRTHSGGYGYGAARRSNIEFAKVEIGVSHKENNDLGARMKRALKAMGRKEPKEDKKSTIQKAHKPPQAPQTDKQKAEAKGEAKAAKEKAAGAIAEEKV